MKKPLHFLFSIFLVFACVDANATAFGNVSGTDFNAGNISSTFDVQVTKPSAILNGVLEVVIAAINSQAAGTHLITNLTGETVVVSTNSATLFQAGVLWRAGLTADAATVDYNNSNAANAQKSAMVLVITGHNTVTPIRAFACNSGNSASPVSPTTSSLTSGDLILRTIVWDDDGDELALTHPGSHTSIAADFKPTAAGGKAIGVSFTASSGGAPGTANWTIALARDYVACTIGIAGASASAVPQIHQQLEE